MVAMDYVPKTNSLFLDLKIMINTNVWQNVMAKYALSNTVFAEVGTEQITQLAQMQSCAALLVGELYVALNCAAHRKIKKLIELRI